MKRAWPLIFVSVLGLAVFLWGCAPVNLYHVSVRYEPTKPVGPLKEGQKGKKLVVTLFRDMRKVDDPVKMGWVLERGGKKLYVLPERDYPDKAVTEAASNYLHHQGFSILESHPSWDLEEGTIDGRWGDIVIGGAIEEMWVTCDNSDPFMPAKTFAARVKLKVVLADGRTKRIIYKTEAEAEVIAKDFPFSEEKLSRHLNSALRIALEKIFTDEKVTRVLTDL
jgi:hypothetical protein